MILSLVPFLSACGRIDRDSWALKARNTLGTLECQTDAKLQRVVRAFDSAMGDLGYRKKDADVKTVEAVLTYEGTGTVTVKIKEFPTFTNIKVRAGVMGDEELTRKILDRAYTCL